MFFDEEDEIFGGTPKSKFFDIVFNANRNLVEFELEKLAEKLVALEALMEQKDEDFLQKVQNFILENPDAIHQGKNDFFIGFVGDVLSSHE